MSIIAQYLAKQNFVSKISTPPVPALKIVVVIPCRNEPDIKPTLDSLNNAAITIEQQVEIIIVINDQDLDSEEVYTQNIKTLNFITNYQSKIPLYAIRLHKIQYKKAGVGFARKSGMDEAISRLDQVHNKSGILCSMDADTTVDLNYFSEIINGFSLCKKDCLVINYLHKTAGLNKIHSLAITHYELHLRYYVEALRWAGVYHAYQTLGSAIAVKATSYAALGGMSSRQAGEDFYFIHKYSKISQVAELNTTTVYPSARVSNRVPFGTGKAIGDVMSGKTESDETYPLLAFIDLKAFLDQLDEIYYGNINVKILPDSIQSFLTNINFEKILQELKSNTATLSNFKNRFFQKMDAFMMMKYVHHARDHYFGSDRILYAANKLLALRLDNYQYQSDVYKLLEQYRNLNL